MSGPQPEKRFNLIQVAVRVWFSCALTALVAVATFSIIRYFAGAD